MGTVERPALASEEARDRETRFSFQVWSSHFRLKQATKIENLCQYCAQIAGAARTAPAVNHTGVGKTAFDNSTALVRRGIAGR